eukprot:m.25181 g.25181  ORF g.25181 m.25181 type:complete len:51 (+) comp9707_c0_seq2:144-296(+)
MREQTTRRFIDQKLSFSATQKNNDPLDHSAESSSTTATTTNCSNFFMIES